MRGYGQFCPIAKAAEIFAERWTPLILRELVYTGSSRFNQLRRGIPLISQTLLAQRLRSLERDGVIEIRRASDGRGCKYHLTPAGQALRPVLDALGSWGQCWTYQQLRDEGFDPSIVMWLLRAVIKIGALPGRRVVVRFEFREGRHRLWWLILDRPEIDVCLRDEGFDVDLYVTADARVLGEVILGRRDVWQAVRDHLLEVDGPRDLVRDFPGWIGVSPFADGATSAPAGRRAG